MARRVGGVFGGEPPALGTTSPCSRAARTAALRERGLTVRGPEGEFIARVGATDDIDGLPTADLAVIAVKSYPLADVIPVARARRARRERDTTLNGVTAADELIAGGVPRDRVLGGLARVSAGERRRASSSVAAASRALSSESWVAD